MKELICKALKENRLVNFEYEGRAVLTVEPYVLGVHDETQKQVLLGHLIACQPDSKAESVLWNYYDVEEMENFKILDEYFYEPRDDYDADHPHIREVTCAAF
jgi:hypothetical protein